MASVEEVLKLLNTVPEGYDNYPGKLAHCSFCGVDEQGSILIDERMLQWWPESLSDSIETGWNPTQVPGGSHSLMKWGANGGRTITFDVKLTRMEAPRADVTFVEDAYNVDVAAAVKYLRAFCYPRYASVGGFGLAKPPPICVFNAPNVKLDESGSDLIESVMVGCDVNYLKFFPDGTPKIATVSISLKQTVQGSGGVKWVDGAEVTRLGHGYSSAGHPSNGTMDHYVRVDPTSWPDS